MFIFHKEARGSGAAEERRPFPAETSAYQAHGAASSTEAPQSCCGDDEARVDEIKKAFAREMPDNFDKVVVYSLRTALACRERARVMIADLLVRLRQDRVLDCPSLVWGFAALICTWQALARTKGHESLARLAEILLTCIRSRCMPEEFLTRLPEGFLTAVLRDGRAKDMQELGKARDRLHHFRRFIEEKKLLESPPHIVVGLLMEQMEQVGLGHELLKQSRNRELVKELRQKGVLTKEDGQWAVLHLLPQLEDAFVDEHLHELANSSFVLRCRMLQVYVFETSAPDAQQRQSETAMMRAQQERQRYEMQIACKELPWLWRIMTCVVVIIIAAMCIAIALVVKGVQKSPSGLAMIDNAKAFNKQRGEVTNQVKTRKHEVQKKKKLLMAMVPARPRMSLVKETSGSSGESVDAPGALRLIHQQMWKGHRTVDLFGQFDTSGDGSIGKSDMRPSDKEGDLSN